LDFLLCLFYVLNGCIRDNMYIRFLFEACFSADLRCCTMFTTI